MVFGFKQNIMEKQTVLLLILTGLVCSWACQPAATGEEEVDAAEKASIEETNAAPAEPEDL